MPEQGQEETVRIVALDRSFHVNCYICEVGRLDEIAQHAAELVDFKTKCLIALIVHVFILTVKLH